MFVIGLKSAINHLLFECALQHLALIAFESCFWGERILVKDIIFTESWGRGDHTVLWPPFYSYYPNTTEKVPGGTPRDTMMERCALTEKNRADSNVVQIGLRLLYSPAALLIFYQSQVTACIVVHSSIPNSAECHWKLPPDRFLNIIRWQYNTTWCKPLPRMQIASASTNAAPAHIGGPNARYIEY